jgi:hypothetical protein
VAFVLGDKAVAIARKSELPANVLNMIAKAKRVWCGNASTY